MLRVAFLLLHAVVIGMLVGAILTADAPADTKLFQAGILLLLSLIVSTLIELVSLGRKRLHLLRLQLLSMENLRRNENVDVPVTRLEIKDNLQEKIMSEVDVQLHGFAPISVIFWALWFLLIAVSTVAAVGLFGGR